MLDDGKPIEDAEMSKSNAQAVPSDQQIAKDSASIEQKIQVDA